MTTVLPARLRAGLRHALMLLLTLAMMGLPLHLLPAQASPGGGTAERQSSGGSAAQLSVDEILARHYQAVGGDRHQQLQTIKMSGRSVVMGMEAPYTRWTKRPNKVLLEIYVEGMTGIQAFDGETAWAYMPFMGQSSPAALPPDQTQAVLESADFEGALVHAREKGHQVELLGVEPVNGRDAYKLQLTLKTGGVQTHYVDAETFYLARVVSAAGDAVFLDYRLVDGHPVAMVIELEGAMGQQTIYVDEVEYDLAIDDAAFRMK